MNREQISNLTDSYRATAQAKGEMALQAVRTGDIGLARRAAREAAQHAAIVLQLESGGNTNGDEQEGMLSAQ